MKLSELLLYAGIDYYGNIRNDIEIKDICTDTRKEFDASRTLFVCICGNKYDTHNEILHLIGIGIKCFIVEKSRRIVYRSNEVNIIAVDNVRKTLALISRAFYGFPDKELFKVGVTGTKGKTTITYMLRAIFENASKKCGIIGTNGIIFNGKTEECENSTPGPVEYYRALRNMADSGIEYVFCEVTSQALMQYRTYGTVFDVAVFTNLYPDHIGDGEHTDFEHYRNCKGMLFESCKCGVLCADADDSQYFINICKQNGVDYFVCSASDESADFYCGTCQCFDSCSEFQVGEMLLRVSLPGKFNVLNALCAYAVSSICGINENSIRDGLSDVSVYGRCERIEGTQGVNIIIDYAHTGESLENILSALKETCRGKLYCVFGAGGNRSPLRRAGMGRAAAKYADFSILTNDNPRFEDPEKIISDIALGMKDAEDKYIVIPDRKKAIFKVLDIAQTGDTVLLAGKGNQTYEEICGKRYCLDEREIIREYYNVKKG